MSYFTDFQNPEEVKNLLLKKEFASFAKKDDNAPSSYLNKLIMEPYIVKEGNLVLHSHQKFVANWIYPHTPYSRLLVKHSTGSGKTLLALNIANNFIKHFQTRFDFSDQGYAPTVYIVGFVRQNFQKELMTRPEFGFVNKQEVEEYKRLKFIANTGSKKDRDSLTDFESRIKKRFSKRTRGGFYKFLGYKELYNRLFSEGDTASITSADTLGENVDEGTNIISILQALKSGKMKINMEFLDTFANSLLICDEIHNTYNSVNINNYGTAIQIILDVFDSPDKMNKLIKLSGKTVYGTERMNVLRNSNIRAIYMSATPINNNPTEIIDLLNLLIPWSSLPEGKKLTYKSFFTEGITLKPDALSKVGKLSRGYVSFLRDENPELYPQKNYSGETISVPPAMRTAGLSTIPYLKFIRCPISKYHYNTYKKVYTGTLPPDGQTLIDMVIPNPETRNPETYNSGTSKKGETSIGLFRSRDIKYALTNASQAWKNKNKINFIKQSISGSTNAYIISGDFWALNNIEKYSTKYAQLIRSVFDNLRNDSGKIIISHQYVKLSGVLGIQELMRRNGIIDEFSSPSSSTLCSRCGKPMSTHSQKGAHEFQAARFITLYGDLDRTSMGRGVDKFNSPDNVDGYGYRIVIGSSVLNEALDFKAVRNLWIVSTPPDISTLIQIIGRGYRSKSAMLLSPEKRTLTIKIFVSSLPKAQWKNDMFYEEKKYYEKIQLYIVNQKLDKELNENAVDGPINYRSIFRGNEKTNELGPIHYDLPDAFSSYWKQVSQGKRKVRVDDLHMDTFNVWHEHEEIENIIYSIKRIFIEQSAIWTYKSLWEMVKNPPFDLATNTELFDEDNFKLALYAMSDANTVDAYSILMKSKGSSDISQNPVDRLFNHLDRRVVFPNGDEGQIKFINGYYILFPIKSSDIMDSGLPQLGLESIDLLGYPDIDIDSWYRHDDDFAKTSINITKLLKTSQLSYSQMKYKFYKSFRNVPIQAMPISAEIYDTMFHKRLLEDAVRYAFHVMTNKQFPVSELHDFYFKMLYFYDRLEMILFASHIPAKSVDNSYGKYTTKPNPKINPYNLEVGERFAKKEPGLNAFLITSIAKNSLPGEINFDRLNEFISRTKDVGTATEKSRAPGYQADVGIVSADPGKALRGKKQMKITQVPSNMLPVGHFLNIDDTEITIPFMYEPESDE